MEPEMHSHFVGNRKRWHSIEIKHRDYKTIIAHNQELMEREQMRNDPIDLVEYRPIKNFDPKNPPVGYIVVKMDRSMLVDMLYELEKRGAAQIAVACEKLN